MLESCGSKGLVEVLWPSGAVTFFLSFTPLASMALCSVTAGAYQNASLTVHEISSSHKDLNGKR